MITTTIDVSAIADLGKRFVTASQADTLLRLVALGMQERTFTRIHDRGEKADNKPIGKYSDSYMKLRQSKKYNRDASRKIILSLTRQMEGDYKVIALSENAYSLGFDNQFNADKADWAEERFGKIFALTDDELGQVRLIVKEYLDKVFT